ncbi:BPSS1780 family membrane protein [Methyloversatilis sp.]|uniref:BPSS1780 family membrane protein n=1 Tax=Methyloversatilis sp. TaxID=2569862 RepID=UPI0035B1D2C8
MAVNLQARTLPALAGWSWISGGFALFRRNPPLMTALTMSYLLIMVFLNIVPLLGPLLVAVCLPIMSVIVFNGARILDEQREINAEGLKLGLMDNARALVQLGFVHLGGSLLVVLLHTLLFQPPEGGVTEADEAQFIRTLMQLLPLVLPLILVMWFPPYLIAAASLPLGKSLFFGAVAVVRNAGAFVVYFAGAAMLGVGLPMLIVQVLTGDDVFSGMLRFLLRMTLLFALVPTLAASLYVSFRQVFAPAEPSPADPADE